VSIRSSKWLTKFYIMYQFKSVNPSSRHVSQAQIGATLKNWILAMFLKPFVADRWILVSLPSPNGEVVVAVFGSRGAVAAASMPVWAQAVWGCLEVGRHEGRRRSGPAGDGAEGGSTRGREAVLGAEAARNQKPNRSQSELYGVREERSSVLVQFF
jgi:hypothetical protein